MKLTFVVFLSALFATSSFIIKNAVVRKPFSKSTSLNMGLNVDMEGKTVFVAGVADSTGYGWAIAKACAEAGAKVRMKTVFLNKKHH